MIFELNPSGSEKQIRMKSVFFEIKGEKSSILGCISHDGTKISLVMNLNLFNKTDLQTCKGIALDSGWWDRKSKRSRGLRQSSLFLRFAIPRFAMVFFGNSKTKVKVLGFFAQMMIASNKMVVA